jgi:type IV secretion system protein VirB6
LVFDLAGRAPVEIAALISAPMRGHALAADPVAGLQASYDQLRETANAFAHPPKSVSDHAQADYATASEALSMAANGLFIASAGLISVMMIAIGLLTATGPLFIATFLFFETRGLFVGWVRALAAAAFGLLSGWSLTVLMLHAVDPWMDALSDVGANGLSDARTGVTAAIIVLVFCAAQFGLMLAGIMIARGFRLPSRVPRAASQAAATQTAQALLPLDLISRPARLAEQLAHQETSAAYGERTHAPATSVTYARREGSSPVASSPARIGDSYRRPAVMREGRRA